MIEGSFIAEWRTRIWGHTVEMSLVNVWQEQHGNDPQITLHFTEERMKENCGQTGKQQKLRLSLSSNPYATPETLDTKSRSSYLNALVLLLGEIMSVVCNSLRYE